MKIWMLILLTASAFEVAAQSTGDPYIPWRSNDPFVFCTEGPSTQGDNHWWIPIDPASGTWAPTGLPYNQPNYVSVGYYLAICPRGGGRSSDWTGTQSANMVPYKH